MNKIIEIFNRYYPDKTIKPLQYSIIENILDKKSVIGILPTGYGKSVCYILPYLLNQDKIVIVVSPLISLIEDQYSKLKKMNINTYLYSSSSIKNISNGIFFVTPEFITNNEHILQNNIILVAIDEAHCISSWGQTFRPSYTKLNIIKKYNIPILALTATATINVQKDIINALELNDPVIFKTSLDRPNLTLNINKKKNLSCIYNILDKYKNDSVIIYCNTRNDTEKIYNILIEDNYNADIYHAGFDYNVKLKIQNKFINNEINIIVATVAFGMGIDHNVKLIIHWGCPLDLETYYQEIGRAGRDNSEAECYMYYNDIDFKINNRLLLKIDNIEHKTIKIEALNKIKEYCLISYCRKKYILKYFNENINEDYKCNKCDNCLNENIQFNTIIVQIIYPIYIIVKTILLSNSSYNTKIIINIVKGKKQSLNDNLINLNTFGCLKILSEKELNEIINILKNNKLIIPTSSKEPKLLITNNLLLWYNKIIKIITSSSIDNFNNYDNIKHILINNMLKLNFFEKNINIVKDIKFKSTVEQFNEVFNLDLQ